MKKYRVLLGFLMALVMAVGILPFYTDAHAAKTPALNVSEVTLQLGESYKLSLKNAKGTVKWVSKNKKIATVEENGLVTALSSGKVKVYAKYSGKKYACTITVPKVTLNKTEYELKDGKSFKLKLKGAKAVSYKSSDKQVATVSKKGTVRGYKLGDTVITVKDAVGNEYKCDVTVVLDEEGHVHTPLTIKGYAATCTSEGLSDGTYCTVCGEVITKQMTIPVKAHDYENYVCKVCGATDPKKPCEHLHFVSDKKDPTCTEAGYTEKVSCADCGVVFMQPKELKALGHDFVGGVCSRCGKVCGVDVPHVPEVIEKAVPVTCTMPGYTEMIQCKECKAILQYPEMIPELGHDYQGGTHCVRCTADLNGHVHEWVIKKMVLPTCQEPGMTEDKRCATCGYVETVGQFIPRIPHVYVDGKCKKCGKKEDE